MVSSRLTDDFAYRFRPARDRQLNLLLIQPEKHLTHAAQLREFPKDQIDGGAEPGVRIFLDPVIRSLDVSDGDSPDQHAPLCFLSQRRVRTLAKARKLHFADRALHAQQQAIVREPGVILGFRVNQQCADDTAKLQQGVPVAAVARQTRRFNAEDSADLSVAQRAQQAFKARALRSGS